MQKLVKFGKPSGPLLEQKKSFFQENEQRLADAKKWSEVYASQPRRLTCKNCEQNLGKATFVKLGVEYIVCSRCGQLNGAHLDTEEFCACLYTDDDGVSYGKSYILENRPAFEKRRDDIYVPKAEFLVEALCNVGEDPNSLNFSDFGAGSGYFVAALKHVGLAPVNGYEVSKSQVHFANAMINENAVLLHEPDETINLARNTKADVVSLIGVLEHLDDPRGMLGALADNEHVRYFYFSVPLFSLCVFIEMVFPQVMPRQLTAGHTHLYTESSIDWFCNEFGFERVAEWWFGTDMVDLYRSMLVSHEATPNLVGAVPFFEKKIKPAMDAMQMALDERQLSSEVHMVLKKK